METSTGREFRSTGPSGIGQELALENFFASYTSL
jgi:hypothetical protein